MRPALVGLIAFAVQLSGATAQFSLAVPQPLRVRQPFNLHISSSSDPKPFGGSVTFTLDGAPLTPVGSSPSAWIYSIVCQTPGMHELTMYYGGDTNYQPSSASVTFEVLPKIPTHVTTPVADPASPGAGQPFVISTVATADEGGPVGYVAFYDGGALLATGTGGLNNVYSANISLPLGAHVITASYVVTGDHENSTSAPLALNIARSATSLSMPALSGTPRFGQPVTFSTTITPAAPGSVTFFDGGIEVATSPINSGVASFTSSSLSIGSHDIVARYAGNADFVASASPLLKQSIKGLPAITLTSSRNPSPNAEVTFSATAASPTALAPAPTGSITLFEGATKLGTLPIALTLAAGEHTLMAAYSGDTNYEAAASAPLLQRFTGSVSSNTAITLTVSDAAALNIRVTSTSPIGPTPTGTVRIGEASLPLTNGTATIADARALLGKRVTADYSGDAIHAASSAANQLILAPVNAFSYTFAPFAPSQIVTVFGDSLDGATAQVGDKSASMYFASTGQATFALPDTLTDGSTQLTIFNGAGQAFTALLAIARTAPGIATATADGQGAPAAQLLRVRAGSTRNEALTGPIVFNGDEVYLILYGTGFRHASSPVTCTIAGRTLTAAYAGAQGDYPGLDQINLLLDAALTHAGSTTLTCSASGRVSNAVTLLFP